MVVCWWTVSHWWMLVPRLSPALATAEQLLARHQRSPAAVRVNTEWPALGRAVATRLGAIGENICRLQTEASLLTN